MKSRLFLIITLVICGVAAALYLAYILNGGSSPRFQREVNQAVPRMIVPPLHNKTKGIDPDDFKGQVTLVSFFASWCGPCHLNNTALLELANTHGIRVIGVNIRDQTSTAQLWLMANGNPFQAIGSDPNGQAAAAWGVQSIPHMFIVDKKANIRLVMMGALTPQKTQEIVLPFLKKLSAETP